jgi:hypothetical protein
LPSHGGRLLIREFDEQVGFTEPFAATLPERSKKRFFNRRRQHHCLAEGPTCTQRRRLINVAVEVVVSSRRVLVKLSSRGLHLSDLFHLGRALAISPSG